MKLRNHYIFLLGTIVFSIAAGLTTSSLIAYLCWRQEVLADTPVNRLAVPGNERRFLDSRDTSWRYTIGYTWGSEAIVFNKAHHATMAHGDPPAWLDFNTLISELPADTNVVAVFSYGYPMPAYYSAYAVSGDVTKGIVVAGTFKQMSSIPIVWYANLLPTSIRLVPLIVNSLVLAIPFAILAVCFRVIRHAMGVRRQRLCICVKCRYPVGGVARCPECGFLKSENGG